MDPSFWGRSTWLYLHTLTFNYPEIPTESDKVKYYNYFKQLPEFLPCPSCADSFKLYFDYIPINNYLDDVYGITFWLYTIHFIVNRKLSKKNMDFYDVIKLYLPNKTSCIKKDIDISSKCTKPSSENTDSIKYKTFKETSENKYFTMTKLFISKLLNDYPSLY
jgi:hypothetical protein